MINKETDLAAVIRRFSRNFQNGKPLYNAYFVVSDKLPMGTVHISKIDALKIRPLGLSADVNAHNDYAVALHPDYLALIVAEFRRILPGQKLTDKEMAAILVGGSI